MIPATLLLIMVTATLHAKDAKPPLPWLGMGVRPFSSSAGERLLHVERTTSGGPSDRAGVRPGDIITALQGVSLRFDDDLAFLLFIAHRKPGERLTFTIVRDGKARNVTVTLARMPESSRAAWEQGIRTARQKRIAAEQRRR